MILGIIELVTGILLALAYALPSLSGLVVTLVGVPPTFTFLLPALAVLWFTFAILSFVLAYAVWTGRGWSWVTSFVFATNALTVGAFGLLIGSLANIIPIVVITLVLISLGTYNVRWYLGRVPSWPTAYVTPPVAPTAYSRSSYNAPLYASQMAVRPGHPQATPSWVWMVTCPTCGAQSYPGSSFCTSCAGPLR